MTLHIYGTPGQSRFDFMWDLLIRKAHAYILLVPAHRPQEFRQARQILSFMNQRVTVPLLIGVTHVDCDSAWSLEDVALSVWGADQPPPIVAVNANDKASVTQALIALVEHYLESSLVG